MDETKLLLYPQLLLACFAMLPTSYMHIYALIIDLLQKVIQQPLTENWSRLRAVQIAPFELCALCHTVKLCCFS